jgi:hypothetical protein
MLTLGLGLIPHPDNDDRLQLRTWKNGQNRWYLDGNPVNNRDRRVYLNFKKLERIRATRGTPNTTEG